MQIVSRENASDVGNSAAVTLLRSVQLLGSLFVVIVALAFGFSEYKLIGIVPLVGFFLFSARFYRLAVLRAATNGLYVRRYWKTQLVPWEDVREVSRSWEGLVTRFKYPVLHFTEASTFINPSVGATVEILKGSEPSEVVEMRQRIISEGARGNT